MEMEQYEKIANKVRQEILNMVYRAKAPHIGSSFSIVEILVALYFKSLCVSPETSKDKNRDIFLLSKGHACPALYAVLAERGFFKKSLLNKFSVDGGVFEQHPARNLDFGIELSSGSLGHCLSIGAGMALARKNDSSNAKVFVLMGDGELQEGSVWEAAMFASHHKLDNLVAIVDRNKLQALDKVEKVLNLDPLKEKWQSFGWQVQELNGHSFTELIEAFDKIPFCQSKPSVIIAYTIKGKGVSFMEDNMVWHSKHPDEKEYQLALKELTIK